MGDWTIWIIGNGTSVRVRKDPWASARNEFKLLEKLVNVLHNQGIFSPWDAKLLGMDGTS
jgi:hypothetical protein